LGYSELIAILNASAIFVLVLLGMLLMISARFRGEIAYVAVIIIFTTIPVYLYNVCRSAQWYVAAEWFAPFALSVNTILMPLLWLFVYRNFNQNFRFTKRQLLHFLPSTVSFTLYLSYAFSLPAAERFNFMIHENTVNDMFFGNINSAIIFIQMFVYFTIMLVYLFRVKKLIGDNFSEAEWMCKQWIPKFVILFVGSFFIVSIGYTLWPRINVWLPQILNVMAMSYLTYHALDAAKISQTEILSIDNIRSQGRVKTDNVSYNHEQLKEYAEKMLNYLHTTEAYTNPNLTLHDISSATGISYNNLSKAFNTILGKTFFETINHMRIEKAKLLLHSYKKNNHTLETLAEQCGFNSRVIFSNAFKKITGVTTSQWLKIYKNK